MSARRAFPAAVLAALWLSLGVVAGLAVLTRPSLADECSSPTIDCVYPNGSPVTNMNPTSPFRAKDFTFFKRGDTYHIFNIRTFRATTDTTETAFGHAVSTDLVHWTQRSAVVPKGQQSWENDHVWAPSVVTDGTLDYMFFTGVNALRQTIGYATCNPATDPNLDNWTLPSSGNPVLQCGASGTGKVTWIGCGDDFPGHQLRDPFVMRDPITRTGESTPGWLMFYTAIPLADSVTHNYAVGVAHAAFGDLTTWTDLGPLMQTNKSTLGSSGSSLIESPHVFQHAGLWYLVYTGDYPQFALIYQTTTSADPASPTAVWTAPALMKDALGPNPDPLHPQLWFASEYLQDGANEYLACIHDYDPAPSDPIQSDVMDVDIRRIVWTAAPNLTLVDPTQAAQWMGEPSAPWSRQQAGSCYDTARHRIVTFGGLGSGGLANDVSALSTTGLAAWSSVTTTGTAPTARRVPGCAYDSARDRMLVFGGFTDASSFGSPKNDLYALSFAGGGAAWSTVTTTGTAPFLFYGTQAVYDPVRDRLLVVEGSGIVYALALGSTPPAWSTLAYGGFTHEGGEYFSLVYDSVKDRLVAFGGWIDGPVPALDDQNGVAVFPLSGTGANAWADNAANGPPPSGRSLCAAAYDPVMQGVWIHGGQASAPSNGTVASDTWFLHLANAVGWSPLPASGTSAGARAGAIAQCDPTNDRVFIASGWTGSAYTANTNSFTYDLTPPASVTDFTGQPYCTRIYFTWTATGDDGTTGTAAQWELRRSGSPISSESAWSSATIVADSTSAAPGTAQAYNLDVGACSTRYYYALKITDEEHNWSALGAETGRIGTPCPSGHAGCIDDAIAVPIAAGVAFDLDVVSGSPSRGAMTLRFGVPAALAGGSLRLAVYDVAGRRVRQLAEGAAVAGNHEVDWDGRSESGARAPRGVYFVRYAVGGRVTSRTVVWMP